MTKQVEDISRKIHNLKEDMESNNKSRGKASLFTNYNHWVKLLKNILVSIYFKNCQWKGAVILKNPDVTLFLYDVITFTGAHTRTTTEAIWGRRGCVQMFVFTNDNDWVKPLTAHWFVFMNTSCHWKDAVAITWAHTQTSKEPKQR